MVAKVHASHRVSTKGAATTATNNGASNLHNGAASTGGASAQSATSNPLMAEIEALSNDKANAERWAIDNAAKLASLNGADLALAKHALSAKGARSTFLDRDLPKILKAAKPTQKMAGANGQPSWSEYQNAFKALGCIVRMNQLDDTVEVNSQKLSDGIEAEIIMRMADAGYSQAEWVKRALAATAHRNRYHPVKQFLDSLKWDGKDWIAEFERYVRDRHPQIIYKDGSRMPVFGAFTKRWGVAAVGKVYTGGNLRVQNSMLVFIGPQGGGKSTLTRFFCPMSDEYFIESHINPESNDHLRYLSTKLVWEVAELGATTRKADREALKSFLTRQDATFRVPFAKHPVTKPALTSFIGTINPEIGFLNDPTGHRRYLPVEIEKIDFSYINAIDPLQLWAQFVALYHQGESAKLTPEETAMADSIRIGHEVEDQFAGFVTKFYNIDLTKTEPNTTNLNWSETTADIVYQLTINKVNNANTTNIGLSLKSLGLTHDRPTVNGKKDVRWFGMQRNNVGIKVP